MKEFQSGEVVCCSSEWAGFRFRKGVVILQRVWNQRTAPNDYDEVILSVGSWIRKVVVVAVLAKVLGSVHSSPNRGRDNVSAILGSSLALYASGRSRS